MWEHEGDRIRLGWEGGADSVVFREDAEAPWKRGRGEDEEGAKDVLVQEGGVGGEKGRNERGGPMAESVAAAWAERERVRKHGAGLDAMDAETAEERQEAARSRAENEEEEMQLLSRQGGLEEAHEHEHVNVDSDSDSDETRAPASSRLGEAEGLLARKQRMLFETYGHGAVYVTVHMDTLTDQDAIQQVVRTKVAMKDGTLTLKPSNLRPLDRAGSIDLG